MPHWPARIGRPLYGQWFVRDNGANPADMTASEGARVTLGGLQ